tara:strand:- start:2953 stop:3537 length:585 start_codon:yes stop_codon:yes gene_type:complete
MFFFFIFHHLFQIFGLTDLKRNCLTAIIGSTCYFLLWGYLHSNLGSSFIINAIKDWFYYLVVIDVICIGIIYKTYYGRSIVNEIGGEEKEDWAFDDRSHQYINLRRERQLAEKEKKIKEHEKKLAEKTEIFNNLLESKETLDILQDKSKEIEQLKQDVKELDTAIRYAPGGEIAKECEQDFYELAKFQNEEVNK